MASSPTPRLVVQTVDAHAERRRRLAVAAGLVGCLLIGLVAGWLAGRSGAGTGTIIDRGPARQLAVDNEALRQQVAVLTRDSQVGAVAATELRHTLAEREEQLNGLRNDLGFYSRLVGGGDQRQELTVQDVRLSPIARSHAWNLTVTLTQNARRGADTKGRITLAVEGLRGDKLAVLDAKALGGADQAGSLAFSFRYFQQLHTTLALPADFRPTRLRIGVDADGSDAATRTVAWADASQTSGDNHVQQ
jgi:uncharacterized protein DUF6776